MHYGNLAVVDKGPLK